MYFESLCKIYDQYVYKSTLFAFLVFFKLEKKNILFKW